MNKFCYLDGAKSQIGSFTKNNEWMESVQGFFLTSKGLPLGAKGRLHSTCVQSVVLYGTDNWP